MYRRGHTQQIIGRRRTNSVLRSASNFTSTMAAVQVPNEQYRQYRFHPSHELKMLFSFFFFSLSLSLSRSESYTCTSWVLNSRLYPPSCTYRRRRYHLVYLFVVINFVNKFKHYAET
jgi:hypothetical protein